MRLAAVGEICEDIYLPEGTRRPGGISANFAYHVARLGGEGVLFGALGDDEAAGRLAAALADSVVDTAGVVQLEGPSTIQRLRVEAGERVFCGFDPGVSARYRPAEHDRDRLARCDAIALSDGLPELLAACRDLGPPLVIDFSQDTDGNAPGRPDLWIRPWLAAARIAFVGGRAAFRGPLEALARETDAVLVLTAGADGAFAWHRGGFATQASLASSIVDTNGCGDAFAAAFSSAWLSGAPLDRALEMGARSAAFVAGRFGAQPR